MPTKPKPKSNPPASPPAASQPPTQPASPAVSKPASKPAKRPGPTGATATAAGSGETHLAPPPAQAGVTRYQGFEAVTIHRREIRNAPYNPRTITPAGRRKLKRSLEKFKLVETLVWNRRTGNLVGGHQRLSLLDELEGTDDYRLTVSRIDVDDSQERALNVVLNNPEAQGNYDMDLLGQVIGGLLETAPSLVQDAGLDHSSLAMLFGDGFLAGEAATQADRDAPDVQQLNDMYEAGREAERAKRTGPAPATPAPSPDPSPAPDDPARWTNADFAARRKEFNGQAKQLDEADVYLAVTFDSALQLAAFRDHLGLKPGIRAVDAVQVFGLLELDLAQVEQQYRAQEGLGEPAEAEE